MINQVTSMTSGISGNGFTSSNTISSIEDTVGIPDQSTKINKLLNSDVLFDKYIDVVFTKDREYVDNYNTEVSNFSEDDFIIRTPRSGCKPDISVSFEFLPSQHISSVTLTMKNVYMNLDINKYKYIFIKAGYLSNKNYSQCFQGQIFNSYCEKPNPDGQLVFQCLLTDIVEFTKVDKYEVTFTVDEMSISRFIAEVLNQTKLSSIFQKNESMSLFSEGKLGSVQNYNLLLKITQADIDKIIPAIWKTQEVFVSRKTYYFNSSLLVINWVNSIICNYMSKKPELIPISLYLINDRLYLFGSNTRRAVKALQATNSSSIVLTKSLNRIPLLNKVSNVYAQGYHVIAYAPWNPLIVPTGLFAIPLTYIKQFINFNLYNETTTLKINELSGILRPYSIEVNFSTTNTNMMKIDAIDLSYPLSEGDTSQGESLL